MTRPRILFLAVALLFLKCVGATTLWFPREDSSIQFAGLESLTPDATSVTARWAAGGSGIVAYRIYNTTDGSPVLIGRVSVPTLNYTVTDRSPNTTYEFLVKAENEAGNIDTNQVRKSVTTLSSPSTEGLVRVSDLVLWLRADSGVTKDGQNEVTRWNDRSAAGHDFTSTSSTPTWVSNVKNGQPGLRFLDIDLLQNTTMQLLNAPHTVFVVYARTSGPLGKPQLIGENGTNGVSYGADDEFSGASPLTMKHVGGSQANSSLVLLRNEFAALSFASDGVFLITLVAQMRKNKMDDSNDRTLTGVNSSPGVVIGPKVDGDICEVIVYGVRLTAEEISQVEDYLLNRYAIASGG